MKDFDLTIYKIIQFNLKQTNIKTMEQRDYILREIEKIELILRAIRQNILGGQDRLAINIEKQVDDAKGMLLNELNFDIDKFLLLNIEESNEYLSNFEGFNIDNIEQLSECISQIGFSNKSELSKKYLEKALQLYELINLKSKTYSFERERNIMKIKNALQYNLSMILENMNKFKESKMPWLNNTQMIFEGATYS